MPTNTSFIIKSIQAAPPSKHGGLSLSDDKLFYKGWFKTHVFPIADIVLIDGYEEVTMGLEEVVCIDVTFNDGRKLLLSSTTEQQVFINQLLQKLKVATIDWSQPFVFIGRTVLFVLPD